jgi:DNA-binding transcriptional MerR regulator
MKIGELAQRTGISIETIRFYEAQGLLPPAARAANNYRVYTPEHVEQLAFIAKCRSLDMAHTEIRRLLEALGLPFEESCLRFWENDRAVRTASSEQVRRPIFKEGTEQWLMFEPYLDPLKAALGPVLSDYPAVPASSS